MFIYNFFLLHKLSLSEKTNLFPFITMLVKRIFKYETIFSCISLEIICFRKTLHYFRYQKFLFKKHGGDKHCCTQRILFHLGSTSFISIQTFCFLWKEISLWFKINRVKNRKNSSHWLICLFFKVA